MHLPRVSTGTCIYPGHPQAHAFTQGIHRHMHRLRIGPGSLKAKQMPYMPHVGFMPLQTLWIPCSYSLLLA